MILAKLCTRFKRFLCEAGRSVSYEDMQLFDDLLEQLILPRKESGRMRGADHFVLVRSAAVRFPCSSSIPFGEEKINIIHDIFCLSCLLFLTRIQHRVMSWLISEHMPCVFRNKEALFNHSL